VWTMLLTGQVPASRTSAALRMRPSVPWDVPVVLVPVGVAPGALTLGPLRRTRVDIGCDLPGIEGWEAVTGEVDGRRVLAALAPIVAAEPLGVTRADAIVPLEVLLEELRDVTPEGASSAPSDGPRQVRVAVAGTAFTHAVLTALLAVPSGGTITYAGLAAVAGRPRAVRAAARVMATNRVPLVLPCHRVLPASGGVGRYGHGTGAKAALLAAEAITAGSSAVGPRGVGS